MDYDAYANSEIAYHQEETRNEALEILQEALERAAEFLLFFRQDVQERGVISDITVDRADELDNYMRTHGLWEG